MEESNMGNYPTISIRVCDKLRHVINQSDPVHDVCRWVWGLFPFTTHIEPVGVDTVSSWEHDVFLTVRGI
ncbi:hypothetical protein G210_1495 [Candida maltosa Xu316]|uniref:Uncharacterized protein n=1 Tax=Candida maltosa (strain Xu316) TaxID=1245528 RepID=M3K025_CANMX|nr:hypothetical protein G210_1495 [Candida maltosa Xu316]